MEQNRHPRYGFYNEPLDPGLEMDLDRTASHPAIAGTFAIDPKHGPNGYCITNSAVPSLLLETADRQDAEFIVDLLTLAQSHFEDDVERAGAIEASDDAQRQELAALELDAHDKRLDGTPATRQVHHGAAGAVEQTRINAIRDELRRRGVGVS